MKYKILIIDDEEDICYSLKRLLERDNELIVDVAYSGEEGLEKYSDNNHDIVVTDLILGQINGLEIIDAIKKINNETILIMITGKGNDDIADEALKKGAYDYFSKPFKNSEFFKVIRNAKEKITLCKIKNKYDNLKLSEDQYYNYHFKSKLVKEKIDLIKRMAKYDSTILITGESGTGKGVLAESIHLDSSRSDKPFIKINCGAIPENLFESELFGYEKGAFTGAVTAKKGKMELADGGTIFLDEIAEIDMKYQAKLLRVIEDMVIEKIGSEKLKKIDVRIIVATNVDIEKAITENKFREDLFYRLNVFNVKIPSLRERKEDIIYLAEVFIKEFCNKFGILEKKMSPKLKSAMLRYNWPGNTRELKNAIENMVILTGDASTIPDNLFPYKNKMQSIGMHEINCNMTLKEYMKVKEKEYILNALEDNKGNKTLVANKLGISRTNLYDKIKELDINE